jgi:hypothetical protein
VTQDILLTMLHQHASNLWQRTSIGGDDTEPPPRMLILISSTTGSFVPPPGSSAPSESETALARPHTWLQGGIRKLRYTLMELFVMVVLESLVNPEI